MARESEFNVVSTESGWMVSIPKSMSATGERTRRFFKRKGDATNFAAKQKASHRAGMRGTAIPALLATEAQRAQEILEGTGLSLVDAAKIAKATVDSPSARETFGERYKRTIEVGESIWSDVYARDMGNVPKWVGPEIMATCCGALNREILKAAVEKHRSKNPSTVKMTMLRVMAVLGDKDRSAAKTGPVDILSFAQAAKLLRVCERREERWAVAVLLFAGIRPDVEFGEIGRLDWSAFGEKEIYIDHGVSKTPSDRHISITDRLRRLTKGHPTDGPVAPSGWRRAWTRIRKDAGISDLVDVTRHTFASNYLAAFGEDETKQALGHTANSQTLFRHYRRAVVTETGKRYFK